MSDDRRQTTRGRSVGLTGDGSVVAPVTHVSTADAAARGEVDLGAHPPDLARWVGLVGLAGPGNIAWRALRRVTASNRT